MAENPIANILPTVNLGNVNWTLIGYVVGIAAVFAAMIIIVLVVLNKKKYNILVEVTPYWSVKEMVGERLVIKEPSKFERMFGRKHPKKLIYQDLHQSSQSYFLKGAYLFNKKTGTYYLQLKGGDKAKIQGIDYKFFKPIKYGNPFFPCIRYIHLLRYGAADYKPIETRFNYTGLKEIKNAYDSEATYVSIATQQEVMNRYKKQSLLLQFAPWIVAVIVCIVFIIATYLISKQLGEVAKSIGSFASQMGEVAKALMSASR
jgi:hypothetical protein